MNTATIPVPKTAENLLLKPRIHVHGPVAARTLPRIERVVRKGPLLHPGPMAEVLNLNLTLGCAHQCGFCSARAYPNYPGDEVVYLFTDIAGRLEKELSSRSQRPRAVLISPSTDPFPPLAEVQEETVRVVEVLARNG